MRLYIDLDLLRFVQSPGTRSAPSSFVLKRGDSTPITLQFCRSGELVSLPPSASLEIGIKEKGDYGDEFLAHSATTQNPATANGPYEIVLSLNTDELWDVLRLDAPEGDELADLQANLEVTWSTDGGATWTSTPNHLITIQNDIVRGDEAVTDPATPDYPPGATVTAHLSDTDNPHAVTKAQVGLPNAENTADADKPISDATQAALDDKTNETDFASANGIIVATWLSSLGLGDVENHPLASQAEAEAGTANDRAMTPFRVFQSIAAHPDTVKTLVADELAPSDPPSSWPLGLSLLPVTDGAAWGLPPSSTYSLLTIISVQPGGTDVTGVQFANDDLGLGRMRWVNAQAATWTPWITLPNLASDNNWQGNQIFSSDIEVVNDSIFYGDVELSGVPQLISANTPVTKATGEGRWGAGMVAGGLSYREITLSDWPTPRISDLPQTTRSRLIDSGDSYLFPAGLNVPVAMVGTGSSATGLQLVSDLDRVALAFDNDGNFRHLSDFELILTIQGLGRASSSNNFRHLLRFGAAFIDGGAPLYALKMSNDDQSSSSVNVDEVDDSGVSQLYNDVSPTENQIATTTNDFSIFHAVIRRAGSQLVTELLNSTGGQIASITRSTNSGHKCAPFLDLQSNPNASNPDPGNIGARLVRVKLLS